MVENFGARFWLGYGVGLITSAIGILALQLSGAIPGAMIVNTSQSSTAEQQEKIKEPMPTDTARATCSLSQYRAHPDWPIHSVEPYSKAYCDDAAVCPSIFVPLSRTWEELNKKFPHEMSRHAINIGANDGVWQDPLYPVLQAYPDFQIVALEPGPKFPKLVENMKPYKNVLCINKGIWASNARGPLLKVRRQNLESIDILKIDIDSCDCHILEELLKDHYFHAKIVQVELNHWIVPPFAYKEMCMNDTIARYGLGDLWGCSMQAAYDIVKPYGYKLLQWDWPDAVFVHENYTSAFPCFHLDDWLRTTWITYNWARDHMHDSHEFYESLRSYEFYRRFKAIMRNKTSALSVFPEMFDHPKLLDPKGPNPRKFLEEIIHHHKHRFTRPPEKEREAIFPLWIEMYEGTSRVGVSITRQVGEQKITYTWH